MNSFQKLDQSNPRYARFFKELVENEINELKEQHKVLNRIARNYHAARLSIKNRNVDLFAIKSVESLEDLIYKTHRESKVERYAKDALSGIAKRRNILKGPGRKRALQAFGRIMDLKLTYEKKQKRYFKNISAVKSSEELADMLENLLDSDTMKKVANSKAVVEYDDGRLALVWIPDFVTSNQVGTHQWCLSRKNGEDYWHLHAGRLNKCYMIVDRGLPASHERHLVAFHMGPDGEVTASHDQEDDDICPETDKDFQQALKVTGARPYNRSDVLQSDQAWLLENYIDHYGDCTLLSQKVLTADNPAMELGRRHWALKTCTEKNLLSSRRLVLAVARQCSEKGTVKVINMSFLNNLCKGGAGETLEDFGTMLMAMMPSIAVAERYCTSEVFELAQNGWEKNKIFENAILFGNRSLVVNMIDNLWGMPSELSGYYIFPEKTLALGAEINRLLLDSGFQPNFYYPDCVKDLMFPPSRTEREAAELYFSNPRIQGSQHFVSSVCHVLKREIETMFEKQAEGGDWHGPVLEDLPWVLENLKRLLGQNIEEYVKHISKIMTLVVGEKTVETAGVRYLPQINLLRDEVDRLKKNANKEFLDVLGKYRLISTPNASEGIRREGAEPSDISLAHSM